MGSPDNQLIITPISTLKFCLYLYHFIEKNLLKKMKDLYYGNQIPLLTYRWMGMLS